MPSQPGPIKVAILWHMHQPNYREAGSSRMAMPWVRLHALKDYLDMPLRAAERASVKTTFNLVPSLLDQIELYLHGGTDRHLELSRLPAEELTPELKIEILDSFFLGFPEHMIKPYPHFRELYNKANTGENDKHLLASLFSSMEVRDIQVWSNLAWIDPMFRSEEPIRTLFAKQRQFTEEDKRGMLDWQIKFMGRILPTYRRLLEEGKIEISFTPYYHPILPLLCDTSIALEAMPGAKLPLHRFVHPEDAKFQVQQAVNKFEQLFGRKMEGMWPSEGSVSEEVLDLLKECGLSWAASDEEILYQSLSKSGLSRQENALHRVYRFRNGLKLFFRDHGLSDLIGFVYSGWKAERAVTDFIAHIKELRRFLDGQLGNVVVPIILDGENAWEYFPDDATEFLALLYERLDSDPDIRTVTMSEAASSLEPRPLPQLFAGSWINHNFRIWIGHAEDNAAWNLLQTTRDRLVQFERDNPAFDKSILKAAWEQIYIGEGSDWCWWYGDEHRAAFNAQFDKIFRHHLIAVFELLGLDIPLDLIRPIYGGQVGAHVMQPESMVTVDIDGRISHYYEWTGAGLYDCRTAGASMHRVDFLVAAIYFAYDRQRFYIRVDFRQPHLLSANPGLRVLLHFFTPTPKVLELSSHNGEFGGSEPDRFAYRAEEVLEIAIERRYLWDSGFGPLGFSVSLYKGEERLEIWPETQPIETEVVEPFKEMFWPIV